MMRDRNAPFRFKQFAVSHHRSSMRVGVDGVLIGAWAGKDASGVRHILDAGCGCGLIALMAAQRFEDAYIDAVDIDVASMEEASANFSDSPWSNRLKAVNADLNEWMSHAQKKYDLIISNPPYFNAGILSPDTPREKARHQDSLSPGRLVTMATNLLNTDGRLALISPKDSLSEIIKAAEASEMAVKRITYVKGNHESEIKRVMVELAKVKIPPDTNHNNLIEEVLVIEERRGEYTPEYKALTEDFYIIF